MSELAPLHDNSAKRPLGKFLAVAVIVISLLALATLGAIHIMNSATLPKASVTTLAGEPTDLTRLAAGKPLVINLWATWCPPCRREMPLLADAQEKETDITFVFVNEGENKESVERYLASTGFDLTNVVLDPGAAIGRELGSMALPMTLFSDKDGRLVDSRVGGLTEISLAEKLERLRGHK